MVDSAAGVSMCVLTESHWIKASANCNDEDAAEDGYDLPDPTAPSAPSSVTSR